MNFVLKIGGDSVRINALKLSFEVYVWFAIVPYIFSRKFYKVLVEIIAFLDLWRCKLTSISDCMVILAEEFRYLQKSCILLIHYKVLV